MIEVNLKFSDVQPGESFMSLDCAQLRESLFLIKAQLSIEALEIHGRVERAKAETADAEKRRDELMKKARTHG